MRHPILKRTIVLLLLALLCAPLAAEDLNRIILQVNDEILTLHDYETRKANEIQVLLGNPSLTPQESQERLAQIGRQVTQQLFREMLLLSRSKQIGVRVDETQIDAAVREVQQRQGINNQDELIQALSAAGLSLERLRENLKREIIWSQVVSQEVTSQIEISDEEQRGFYRGQTDQFRIPEERHLKEIIVLESSGLADTQLQTLAAEIQEKLVAGEAFEEVAKTYQDQGMSTGIIDLGWLKSEELEAAISDAAWAMKAGEYSEPVSARGGYHIVHIAGVKEAQILPFSDVQDQIINYLRSTRFEKELRTYIAELEESSFIREDLPPEATGFRALAQDDLPEDELEMFRNPLQPETTSDTEEGSQS